MQYLQSVCVEIRRAPAELQDDVQARVALHQRGRERVLLPLLCALEE